MPDAEIETGRRSLNTTATNRVVGHNLRRWMLLPQKRCGDRWQSFLSTVKNWKLATTSASTAFRRPKRLGIEIPHYCWHPGLSVVASCRMCLVETWPSRSAETGEISLLPKLVPACQTPATDGTVFVTDSEKVQAARAMVEEDLLIRHPIDCPICDKAGECLLQDYHFQHGRSERRADLKPFTSRRRPVGDTVTLFVDRCVMCSRCVRFTRERSPGRTS